MPKTPDFPRWMADQANSIIDKSDFIKPIVHSLTPIQIREMFATLNYPVIEDELTARRWVLCLCYGSTTKEVLGEERANQYASSTNDSWFVWCLKKDIAKGWTPKDAE